MDYIQKAIDELETADDAVGESHPDNNHIYWATRAVASALIAIAKELQFRTQQGMRL